MYYFIADGYNKGEIIKYMTAVKLNEVIILARKMISHLFLPVKITSRYLNHEGSSCLKSFPIISLFR